MMLAEDLTRAEQIEREDLIDVAEWAEVRDIASPLPFHAALTRTLWDLTASIPFRFIYSVSADDRVHAVLEAGRRALVRSTEPPLCLDPEQGFTVSFGVLLPSRRDPRWRSLRLVCGPDADGLIVLTIGLAEEFKAIPRAARSFLSTRQPRF